MKLITFTFRLGDSETYKIADEAYLQLKQRLYRKSTRWVYLGASNTGTETYVNLRRVDYFEVEGTEE